MWLDQHISLDPLKKGKKIACLVPSITELLLHLQLSEQVIARTKFCIHPADLIQKIPAVGGTKNINVQKLAALSPDIVIGNIEENVKADLEKIAEFTPVYVSDIKNLADIEILLCDLASYIPELQIQGFMDNLKDLDIPNIGQGKSVVYLIWMNPWMTVGGDTYIHHILECAGFINVFKETKRYPTINDETLIRHKPEYIFLSSEPFPFKNNHLTYFNKMLPESKTYLVDGEIFSWYGKKTLDIPQYLKSLFK